MPYSLKITAKTSTVEQRRISLALRYGLEGSRIINHDHQASDDLLRKISNYQALLFKEIQS